MAEKTEFVQRIHAAAVELEGSTGVPAAVTTAQAILESGFGGNITKDITTGVSSNNLFGIKAVRKEKYVTDWTHEIVDGKSVRVLGKFKAYSSEAESLRDHAEFLARNPRYKSLFSSSDPVQWAYGLDRARYSTLPTPEYGRLLESIMSSWNLGESQCVTPRP